MERELERIKERDAQGESYDKAIYFMQEMTKQREAGKVLLRADEIPWSTSRQGYDRNYSGPINWKELCMPWWYITRTNQQSYRRGKHTHRGGGRMLFCLEGRGRTINNDVNIDWEKGDLELLPVTRTENVHEHFNLDMGKPCGLLVMMFWPFMEATANETRQMTDSPEWRGARKAELYRPDDFVPSTSFVEGYNIQFDGQKPTTLLDDLFLRRNKWRDYMKTARWVVKAKDALVETNRNGIYRWYVHPSFEDVALKQALFWTHEIPAGSRSGKQKIQGGRFHFVLEGHGYSILNDKRYEWGPEDVLLTPISSGGVALQHFNADPKKPALLAVNEPNWYEILGLDMACGFEQIEDCPEWTAIQAKPAARKR